MLEKHEKGEFILTFLDPAEIRKNRYDAFQANKTTGGISTILTHSTGESSKALSISIAADEDDNSKGKLSVHFGPHVLTAPAVFHR